MFSSNVFFIIVYYVLVKITWTEKDKRDYAMWPVWLEMANKHD